jgi:preprotein translocase subunit YajC
LETLFPLLLIVLAFWLLVIRPTRKRQQEVTRTQNAVAPGLEVMLGSGIYGRVVALGDDTLDLEVAPGTHLKVARQAVVRVIDPVEEQERALGDEGTAADES